MRSTIREIRGVTDIGRKSASSLGLGTLGTGVPKVVPLVPKGGPRFHTCHCIGLRVSTHGLIN